MRRIVSVCFHTVLLCGCLTAQAGTSVPANLQVAKLIELPPAGSVLPGDSVVDSDDRWSQLTQQFEENFAADRIDEAEADIRQALALARAAYGEQHATIADGLNKLGMVYEFRDDYDNAKMNYRDAVNMLEKMHGLSHPEVATALNNLANVYVLQGDYAAGEALHLRAFQIRTATLGADHIATAQSTFNLGILYEQSGQLANAELFYKQAVVLWQKVLGREHPNVADSLAKLAGIYNEQGNFSGAEEALLRTLQIRRHHFGDQHVAVADALFKVGKICIKQQKFDEAEPYFRDALNILEQQLGADTPQVAMALYSLANVVHIRGKNEETYARDFEENFAPQSNAAGSLLARQRRAAVTQQIAQRLEYVKELYSAAVPLYQRAALVFAHLYGDQHPTLQIIRDELSMLRQSLNSPESVSAARF